MKPFIRDLIPNKIRQDIKYWLEFLSAKKNSEEIRLSKMPRYVSGKTALVKPNIEFVDAASFLSSHEQIFKNEIYDFKATQEPRIIDCGANIGLAVIYWKNKYPDAEIIALEPDPEIFEVLKRNIANQEYDNVKLYSKGVWKKTGAVSFFQEGADGGYVTEKKDNNNGSISVPVVRLKDFLNEPVDMLKIDIEGAEVEVLKDCSKELQLVDNLFVEYHSYANKQQNLSELLNTLERAGLRYHIKPELVASKPFLNKLNNNGMDNRLNIFAYRKK